MPLQTDPITYLTQARPALKKNKKRNREVDRILSLLGDPQKKFRSVHVGGTNGKGSVSTKLAEILKLSGYKVGLFTSPHIQTLCERIQINGEMISEEYIISAMDRIHSISMEPLHFFEYMFIISCLYFVEMGIDIAVIEVGIGGICDTTNCLNTITSVITSIGEDHKELLGESLHEIAEQKAGIIKKGIPVVLGPHADFPCMHIRGGIIHQVVTIGSYVEENEAVTLEAVQSLKKCGITITQSAIDVGILKMPPCRLERRGRFIYDIAHNPPAMRALLQALPHVETAVVAFSKGKDLLGMLNILAERIKNLIIAPHIHNHLEDQESVFSIASQVGFSTIHIADSEQMLVSVVDRFQGDVIVCGSAYLMGVQIPQTS